VHSGGPGQQLRLQSAAIDQSSGDHDPSGTLRLDRRPQVSHPQDLAAEAEADPEPDQPSFKRRGYLPVVDQSGLGNPEPEQARYAGLVGSDSGGIEQLQAHEPVGGAALRELPKAIDLSGGYRHHQLAAAQDGDPLLGGKLEELTPAAAAQLGPL
jgi:hypothetical protein